MPFCRSCGSTVEESQLVCPRCGARQQITAPAQHYPPPEPFYSHQTVEVRHGPWDILGWIILVFVIVLIVGVLLFLGALGAACASVLIPVPFLLLAYGASLSRLVWLWRDGSWLPPALPTKSAREGGRSWPSTGCALPTDATGS